MSASRQGTIRYFLTTIDDHEVSTSPEDGIMHERMLRKFEDEGDLTDEELLALRRILYDLNGNSTELHYCYEE